MSCVICKSGELKEGKTTVTLERNGAVVVIKDVPARICNNCGHYYLDEEMTSQVYERKANSPGNLKSSGERIKMLMSPSGGGVGGGYWDHE